MPLSKGHNFVSPLSAPVVAPEFPPPLFRQPPSPCTIRRALATPPFSWNGISLRVFRCPSSLSDFSKLEEQGDFLGPEHKYWYRTLRSALGKDLQDLRRRHNIETEMQPSIWSLVEGQEAAEFHEEFTTKLQWGQESSPLLLRPASYLDNVYDQTEEGRREESHKILSDIEFHKAIMKFKKQGLNTKFPSIRTFFGGYPGPSVAWTVQDFYNRQDAARDAEKVGLVFRQMWEWSERHWSFFEAASKLREGAMKEADNKQQHSATFAQKYSSKALNWSPAMECHKRRHQWAVLKRIMRVYESRDETFPEMRAPAGRSFDRYFGKYGKKGGWYPIDKELDTEGIGGNLILQQIGSVESVLEAGGSLAEACAGVVGGYTESSLRVRTPISPPLRTVEEADAMLVRMRVDADTLLTTLRSKIRSVETAMAAGSTPTTVGEEPPNPTDTNGDAEVGLMNFLVSLGQKLIGSISGNPEPEPVEGWLTSWRSPRGQWPGGLKA